MFYFILIFWIIIDIISKYYAQNFLQNKINIIWDFVYLEYIKNPWIAFGIKIYPILLKIITIILIITIFYYYIKEKNTNKSKFLDISFWLILSWAIWNAIERIFYSEVVDFIWVKHFAIFNIADSLITIWWILYIYTMFKNKK